MRLALDMPRRFLRGSATQLVLTAFALACGIALVCAIDLVNRAVLAAFVSVVDTMAGRAALQITAGGAPFAESVLDAVERVAGVELAVPVVTGTAFTADGSGELLTVHGVDVANDAAVRVYEARDAGGLELDDPLVFLSQPDSIVLTRSFAAQHHLAVGAPLDLLTPRGRRTFVVRGLLEPEGIARVYGGNLIVMDLAAAQQAFTQDGMVNRIDVVVRRDAALDAVAQALGAALPSGLAVETPGQRKADLNRVMGSLQVMLHAVSLIALAAAFLIIFNRLTAVFEARVWQLGVLRAVGLRRTVVWWELLKESVLLGLFGLLIGIPLGIAVGYVLLPVVATTAALNFKLIATEADLSIRLPSLLLAGALGLGAAALAAAVPAWRAAQLSPVDTIRGRGVESRGPAGERWLLRALIAAGIVLALAAQLVTRTPAWGLIATGLIAVGAALAARPLVALLYPYALAGLRWIAGPSAWFAAGTFANNARRAALTVAMIGVGIGSIVWLRMLAYSFESSLVHALSGALQGDWVVTSAHIAQGYLEAPVGDELVGAVRGVDGVGDAVGERLVDWRYADGPIAIDAFDARYFVGTAFGHWPLVGAAPPDLAGSLSDGTAVLVSSSFALNLGVAVGDTIELDTPRGRLHVIVGGITFNFSSPRGTIVMSRDVYREHWNDPQVNRVFVRAAAGREPDAVRAAIARQLGPQYGLRIVSAGALIEYFAAQVRRAFAPVDVLAALMLVVILLGLADTLAASMLDRTRELGTVRALGVRRRVVGRAVFSEGLLLGTFGVLLALAAGFALGAMWVRQTFPYLLGWSLETYVPYGRVGVVCGATVVVCLLAAVLPARRAAALRPAVALRYE